MVLFRSRFVCALAGLVSLLVLGSAAAAFALWGEGKVVIANENVTYAGRVEWNPHAGKAGWGHGGMVVRGHLEDAKCNGHWVYVSAKVAGYGYTRLRENHAGCGNRVWDAPTEVYDPQSLIVSDGYVKACQDDWFADTCTEKFMHR